MELMALLEGIKLVTGVISEITSQVKQFFTEIDKKWTEIDDKSTQFGRSIGMQIEDIDAYRHTVLATWDDIAARYGMTAEEIQKFQTSYVENTGRAIMFTDRQLENLVAVQKYAGEKATNDALSNMDNMLGASQQASSAYLMKSFTLAKNAGLNATKAAEAFADNIKLAATYNFREGVNGVAKMVKLSQEFKMNMQSIANVADKFESIDSSIETSAQLQMLGGSYAMNFANPLEAMGLANLDFEGFQQTVIDSFRDKATFNSKTGTFDIDPVTKRIMKEAAKTLGLQFEEVLSTASADARRTEVDKSINKSSLGRLSDSDRDFIRNTAQYDVEKRDWFVNYLDRATNRMKTARVSELTPELLRAVVARSTSDEAMADDVHSIYAILAEKFKDEARKTQSQKEHEIGQEEGALLDLADGMEKISAIKKDWYEVITRDAENAAMAKIANGTWKILDGGMQSSASSMLNGAISSIPTHSEGGVIGKPTEEIHAPNGDDTLAFVKSGEMVLNESQQSRLFKIIAGEQEPILPQTYTYITNESDNNYNEDNNYNNSKLLDVSSYLSNSYDIITRTINSNIFNRDNQTNFGSQISNLISNKLGNNSITNSSFSMEYSENRLTSDAFGAILDIRDYLVDKQNENVEQKGNDNTSIVNLVSKTLGINKNEILDTKNGSDIHSQDTDVSVILNNEKANNVLSIPINEDNGIVSSKPVVGEHQFISTKTYFESMQSSTFKSPSVEPINVNISGTLNLKTDKGNSMNINLEEWINRPENRQAIMNLVWNGINTASSMGGRKNRNSFMGVTNNLDSNRSR